MLRVLTYDNSIDFNATCWDRIRIVKGVEYQTGLLDVVETLKFRLVPVPEFLNPVQSKPLVRGRGESQAKTDAPPLLCSRSRFVSSLASI